MKIKYSILLLVALTQLFLILSLSASYKDFWDDSSNSITFAYSRFAEIENHCSSFLSLASKVSPDENRGYRIKKELSFTHGDWNQEDGDTPLMPFDQSDLTWHNSLPQTQTDPLKLVSFKVMDINSVHHFENAVSIGGVMSIGISRNASYFSSPQSSPFHIRPGYSTLKITFEGVYLETNEKNRKENLMCLLGNTTLPISEQFNHDWDSLNSHLPYYSLLQDDQILLVLRYPQTFNLTKRAVKGEMTSLNEQGSLKYFDKVYISSQLSHYSNYQFSSELNSRSCDMHHPYGANTFNGYDFCSFLQKASYHPFHIFQNYKPNDTHAPQSKLGPFQLGKETSSAWNHENFRLVFQHLICEEIKTKDNSKAARVSAVLRAFPDSMLEYGENLRTGLSGLTLSAEGTWDSSRGKLCMIGCLGIVDSDLDSEGCNSQISMYFPSVFSIKQRSIILGSITSISNETNVFSPLFFDSLRRPKDLKSLGLLHTTSSSYYNYSKVELAIAVKKRNQPSRFFTLIKKLFLKYPALTDGENVPAQLNLLANSLNVHSFTIRHQSPNNHNSRDYLQMEVLSLGTLDERTTTTTETTLLNVSMHLTFTERNPDKMDYSDLHPFLLEGVYDSLSGDMHLIGCRKVSHEGTNVENGLDCLVEVKVQYPSETLRWLKSHSVEMTITSQRSEDDMLHFKPMTLKTHMIPYDKHPQDVAFRKLFEGFLRFLIFLVTIVIILSQLHYMNANEESTTPYVSLGMLSLLIIGYGAELISKTEILFETKESASFRKWPYEGDQEHQLLMESVESPTRLLVLAALLITAWMYQKVSEAKTRPNAYVSNKPKRVPHSKNALQRILKIHIGFCLVSLGLRMMELVLRKGLHLMDAFVLPGVLMRDLEMQILCSKEFFLLPQIFENSLWETQVKPLRKTYYFGLTLLRLVVYLYDYIRDPILDPFYDVGVVNQVGSDFFSICGVIAVPIIIIILASILHIQQSCNYLKPRNH